MDVLVLAPRFPAVNQPWIDTYLEQLQRAGYSFLVLTGLESPASYHEKVDRLGLLDRRVLTSISRSQILQSLVAGLVRSPRRSINWVRKALRTLEVRPTSRASVSDIARSFHMHRFLDSLPPFKVIHSHSLGFGYGFLAEANFRAVPYVLTFHGLEPKGVPQVPERRRLRQFTLASRVFVNTKFAGEQATSLGCPPEKLTVLPQGLPLEDFPFVRKPPPGSGEKLRILTVGRFHREKGQRYALLAARRLLERKTIAFQWDFVGVGPDVRNLRAFVRRLGLESQVHIHEALKLPALRTLYQKAHLFVLPSFSRAEDQAWVETQGVVLQEAQASGCIPIATRVGGIPECINHERDGLLVPQRSHRAIEAAIVWLLEHPDRWPEMQDAARRNVETHFSADVIGERMAELLAREMGGR